ncbi:MAG: RNA polymerase primary sigma factor [Parcubacteria group bacterium Gr01-1014_17]|nr:MAG: RNA polymerase primary sigma factor [Parcubacteria group bacterium Gr01-1014_17]
MNIQTEEKPVTESAIVLPAGFTASLKPAAPLVIAEAKKNGVISTREIAAIIRPEAVSDRYLFRDTIAGIGRYLREMGIILAKGKTDLERRSIPLPRLTLRTSVSIAFKPLTEADLKAVARMMGQGSNDFDDSELALYQNVVRRFPLLKSAETVELFRRRAEGDLEAHFRLILHNLKLVFFLAQKRTGCGLDLSDLVQEGILGLMKAVERFDCERGFQFSTYATWWIRSKIDRAITDKARSIRIPVHLAQKYYQIRRASSALEQELGREPTPEEIGARLQISSRYVAKMLFAVLGTQSESLDAERDLGGMETNRYESIADSQTVSPLSVLEAKETLDEVVTEIRSFLIKLSTLPALDERYRNIFRMRYGLDGTFLSRPTLERIGEKFGVTRERIRQIVEVVWERLCTAEVHSNEGWLIQQLERIEELETVTGTFAKI